MVIDNLVEKAAADMNLEIKFRNYVVSSYESLPEQIKLYSKQIEELNNSKDSDKIFYKLTLSFIDEGISSITKNFNNLNNYLSNSKINSKEFNKMRLNLPLYEKQVNSLNDNYKALEIKLKQMQ